VRITVPKVTDGGDEWELVLETNNLENIFESSKSWSVRRLDTSERIESGEGGPTKYTAFECYKGGLEPLPPTR
jgi:hypothetical protein